MLFSTTLHRMMDVDLGEIKIEFIKTPYNPPEKHKVFDEFKRAFLIFKSAYLGANALLLNALSGRFHPDLLAIIMIGILPRARRPLIALAGAMWQPTKGVRGLFEYLIIKMADRAIGRYVVQSSEEVESFPENWNIDKNKVRLCPYFYSLSEEEFNRPVKIINGGYVFAGGNSHRNYQPLIEAARNLPEINFVVASRLLDNYPDLPLNIKAGEVSHSEFVDLMKSANIVVTPLADGLVRASGQQTYLNAMLLGKPSVVSDSFGVHDHIKNKKNGIIVSGTAESYFQALTWLLDPKNKADVERMTQDAQRTAREDFSKEKHVNRLLSIMQEFLEENSCITNVFEK